MQFILDLKFVGVMIDSWVSEKCFSGICILLHFSPCFFISALLVTKLLVSHLKVSIAAYASLQTWHLPCCFRAAAGDLGFTLHRQNRENERTAPLLRGMMCWGWALNFSDFIVGFRIGYW